MKLHRPSVQRVASTPKESYDVYPFSHKLGYTTMAADEIDTEAALQRELARTLTEAASNGIDVEGAWAVETDYADLPDWDLEIVALTDSRE